MNIEIVDTSAPIFFKRVRTCLFYRKQSYFSDFVGDKYESGASDKKLLNCVVLLLLTLSSACPLCEGTRGGGHKLPSLP